MTLFSATEIAGPDELPGYRLLRLEMLNWGTFHGRPWVFELAGRNGLLTGEIGSGKSTIVDAVTTLLLPAHRIAYNKAAGAVGRERDLRSYVRGHHKTATDEVTGAVRSIGLREGDTYSVLVGVFGNEALGRRVTLAQVFSMRAGDTDQPKRVYCSAGRELSIAKDFTGFGSSIPDLTRRLRADSVTVHGEHFPEYARAYRRLLGVASEQAMDLFAQTVSMKAVGDLNEFVRQHMLEPHDMSKRIDDIVKHFADLDHAHDLVVKARLQLDLLGPLCDDGDEYDRHVATLGSFEARRRAVAVHVDRHRQRLLTDHLSLLGRRIEDSDAEHGLLRERIVTLEARRDELQLERAGLGGDRLTHIESELTRLEPLRVATEVRAQEHGRRLTSAGLAPVTTAAEFAARVGEIADAREQMGQIERALDVERGDLTADRRQLAADDQKVREDLRSLQSRTDNIPRPHVELRARICAELGIDAADLPFAGELIAIHRDHLDWEGAAERLLRGFALSLLVPEAQYREVSGWINSHHLGRRLVYYRVGERARSSSLASADTLAARIEVKPGPFAAWVSAEVERRADLACVDTIEQFWQADRAITREGQIKGFRGRHEKDDARRIDDRRGYVMGWTNDLMIEAVVAEMQRIQDALVDLDARAETVEGRTADLRDRVELLTVLAQTQAWSDIDHESIAVNVSELRAEAGSLQAGSEQLTRVTERLDAVKADIESTRAAVGQVRDRLAVDRADAERSETILRTVSQRLAGSDAVDEQALAAMADQVPASLDDCDDLRDRLAAEFDEAVDRSRKAADSAKRRVEKHMSRFRDRFPLDVAEMDTSVDSLDQFRELRDKIDGDDLPRFEQRFRDDLHKQSINEIAALQAELDNAQQMYRDRVATINDSVSSIEYNPGRYIRLQADPSPNVEVKDFRQQMRDCTAGATSADADRYSEAKFAQVKQLVERFRGRPDFTEADRRWTRLVTDVRNWLQFSASERWRDTDAEHEHYAGSGGKSGGQKEKLAYTVLAASLAYQFGLSWGRAASGNFQFVVIDEAFGRGSDESTRFALDLFDRLRMQLLVITPKQKIGVIAPYVSSIGVADNPDGDHSRIHTLTIEEYDAAVRGRP